MEIVCENVHNAGIWNKRSIFNYNLEQNSLQQFQEEQIENAETFKWTIEVYYIHIYIFILKFNTNTDYIHKYIYIYIYSTILYKIKMYKSLM